MRKQLLYLQHNQLTAYLWVRGTLSQGRVFRNDEAGLQAFSDYLEAHAAVPAHLLADLVEEDFQHDTVPHVIGSARQTLLQRRLGQLYRDTPYRQAHYQGREKTGRKDARVLFSALTNTAQPQPWIDMLLQQKIPLARMYSVALASPLICDKLRLGAGALLLVTHQSGGLRQSYLQDGQLRFSRLTALEDDGAQAMAQTVAQETAKIRQFLASTRQLGRGDLLRIVVIASAEQAHAVHAHCADTSAVVHQCIDLEEAAARLGLKDGAGGPVADTLYLSLLARSAPASHYGSSEANRFYRLWQTRAALYALSALILVTGCTWAGVKAMDAFQTAREVRRLQEETRVVEARYREVLRRMPPTVANPHNMKLAVDLEAMLAQNAPAPHALLGIVSQALDTLPQIQLNKLHWSATEPATTTADPNLVPAVAESALSAALIGIPAKPLQTLLLEGEVAPFDNDYRLALEKVQQFAAALSKDLRLQVEITQAPLNIKPNAVLEGRAGLDAGSAKAPFALKLVWKP